MSGLKKILSPSILSADFKKLGEELETIDKAGAEYVHVDVMDGIFVKSISFGMPVIKSARSATDKVFDVHLMIEEPIRYIEDFVKAGADIITVHVEACKDVVATLEKIKECGVKAAITLNPPTPESLDKVKEIRSLLDAKGLDTDIEIDGGVNAGNLASVLDAGANVIVAGSAIFSGDVADNVKKFKEIMGAW